METPKQDYWRIENVPSGWTAETLAASLKRIDGLQGLESSWLSLFPAYTGNTQTALLKPGTADVEFFSNLDPFTSHSVKVRPELAEEAAVDVYLSIDCHFHGLTPMNTPKGDDIIDVIAVTGLSGHAFGSWRNRKSDRMWLKDFLPNDLKESVRVLTYGYDANLVKPGTRRILDFRRQFVQNLMIARRSSLEQSRPTVFVGHSLGCIVITQALLQSRDDPNYRSILDSTRAVLFFGAPHAGMNVDSLVEMVETITSGDRQSSRLKLLEQLRHDSEFLEDQREKLIEIWKNPSIKLSSFYELQKTPTVIPGRAGDWTRDGEAVQAVENISSLLFLPNETRHPVDANHIDLVKFMHPADRTYLTVVTHLDKCLTEHIAARGEF